MTADALEPDALEPDALEPGALEPGALEPGALEATAPFPEIDLYQFRQKALALSPTYDIFDEEGRPVLHVVRPIKYLRTFLALGGYLATLAYFGILAWVGYRYWPGAPLILIPMGLITASLVSLLIQPYRHVYVFADDTRAQLHMAIVQERKFILLTAPYTLVDGAGNEISRFEKNYLYNIVRKRWRAFAPDGTQVADAWEDSIPKSLARRVVGPLYGLLRTNFILTRQGQRLGEFNRKFTLFDRYVLDLRADPGRTLERRVAVAMGLLLDTGESR